MSEPKKVQILDKLSESQRHVELSVRFYYSGYGTYDYNIRIPYTDKPSIKRELKQAYKHHRPAPPTTPVDTSEIESELDSEGVD